MPLNCARCGVSNPEIARYCRNCGLALHDAAGGRPEPGRAQHPQPLSPPDGYEPVAAGRDLYFRSEAAGGGPPLLGTETMALSIFNGGYDLAHVVLGVHGTDKAGRPVFKIEREIEQVPRGQMVQLEIPSWELPDPVQSLTVNLARAEFAWPSEQPPSS